MLHRTGESGTRTYSADPGGAPNKTYSLEVGGTYQSV